MRHSILDVIAIAALSLAAECAHFSWKQGRHVICADSVQYVDNAEALLSGDRSPHFGFRKPGYSFVLALTALVFGNMAWAAVVANHLFQSLLPLAAYALGQQLRSRTTGWAAAILVIFVLLGQHRAERIMSESAYATIISLAIVLFAQGLAKKSRTRERGKGRGSPQVADNSSIALAVAPPSYGRGAVLPEGSSSGTAFLIGAGLLLGAAWMIRSVATAVILAACLFLAVDLRRDIRRAVVSLGIFCVPVLFFVLAECGLNWSNDGVFRPSTGTLGTTWLMKARWTLGLPFEETESARRCLALLPERTPADAYRANRLDAWVGWHRAVHDQDMDDWQVDRLMKTAACELLFEHPGRYLKSSLAFFAAQAFRPWIRLHAEFDEERPLPIPSLAKDDSPTEEQWYAYWSLPHRTQEEALHLTGRMHADAERKAPIGDGRIWRTLRYVSLHPAFVGTGDVMRTATMVWPGIALVFSGYLGLNRRLCLFLALSYLLDGVLIGMTAVSAADLPRYQSVWLGVDVTLSASVIVCLVERLLHRLRVGFVIGRAQRKGSPTDLQTTSA